MGKKPFRLSFWPSAKILPCLASLFALTLYAITAAPGISWAHEGADGGDLIVASLTWGVPHPSGYPTYCLLGRLFAFLPLGNPARRFALFSVTLSALSVGLTCSAAQKVLQRGGLNSCGSTNALAFAAAIALAASPLLWSQSLIAEVYALNTFFCAFVLAQAVRFDDASKLGAWFALGLTCGTGLGGHLTFGGFIPALIVWLWPWATRRRLICGLAGFILGLSVYAYLPLAAHQNPAVNWGDAHTWQGFWWLVSGRLYWQYVWSTPLQYLSMRFLSLFGPAVRQFTPFGLIILIVGWASWWQAGGDLRRLAVAFLLAISLWGIYAVGYNTVDSYLYLLPSSLFAALALATGAQTLAHVLSHRFAFHAFAVFLVGIGLWSIVRYGPTLSLRNDTEAMEWMETTLRALPPNSLVITGQDRHTFTLAYALWAEKRRPDLLLVDGDLWVEPWYMRQIVQRAPDLDANAITLEDLVRSALKAGRPVCLTDPRWEIEKDYALEIKGPIRCLQILFGDQ